MKKFFLFVALAFAATFSFTSCSDDDGPSSKGSPLSAVAGAALSAIFEGDNPTDMANKFVENVLKFKEDPSGEEKPDEIVPFALLSASGEDEVIATIPDELVGTGSKGSTVSFEEMLGFVADLISGSAISKAPKLGDKEEASIKFPFQFVTGKYTYSAADKSYTIDKQIVIRFVNDKTMQIKYNGREYYRNGNIIQGKLAAGKNTDCLCRAWKVQKVVIDVTGKSTYGKEFTGANLKAMVDDMSNKVNISESDYLSISQLGSIEKIVFATSGEFTIYFTNKIYTGKISDFNVSKGTFKYAFIDQENMSNPVIAGTGTAKVKFTADENVLTIDSKYTNKANETYKIESSIYMQPVK